MEFLKARFPSQESFFAAYAGELPHGGLFVPTTRTLALGTPVVVELACQGLPNHVLVRGRVHARRPPITRRGARAGLVAAFEPEEAAKREFVCGVLRGEIRDASRRRHPRIPVSLPARFRCAGAAAVNRGELLDIALGGALVRTAAPPPQGTRLLLTLVPPGALGALEIAGEVAHARRGDRLGVRFAPRDPGGMHRLREIIRRIRAA
ncbi:MAG TPA: PilZ domain-containing protein [Polyangia bacterium]|jgi:Tfp pilus assembly protein PilZ